LPSAFWLEANSVIYSKRAKVFKRIGEVLYVYLTREGGQGKIKISTHPDTYPVCLHGIDPRFRFGYGIGARSELVYQCPRQDCRHLFIAYYSASVTNGKVGEIFHFRRLEPQSHNECEFSEQITSVSTDFVRIFNQAQHAEELSLSDIAGPGYRKALEFLIKDYATLRNPDASEDINANFYQA
jgi:hypothetical protein